MYQNLRSLLDPEMTKNQDTESVHFLLLPQARCAQTLNKNIFLRNRLIWRHIWKLFFFKHILPYSNKVTYVVQGFAHQYSHWEGRCTVADRCWAGSYCARSQHTAHEGWLVFFSLQLWLWPFLFGFRFTLIIYLFVAIRSIRWKRLLSFIRTTKCLRTSELSATTSKRYVCH